jgi:hypothetical protein
MTKLTFKHLNTILEVLQAERHAQSKTTYFHDGVVKEALGGNQEKLDFLVDQQSKNYVRKSELDFAYFAIKELIDNFN